MDGMITVVKPPGLSSHDVVAVARRVFKQKKIGHLGTLDPAAAGVLVLLLGQATRLAPYLADDYKEYVALVRLGLTTSTDDQEGQTLREAFVTRLDTSTIFAALQAFVGKIQQVPPSVSAVHVQGQRSYKLAREGQEVVLPPKEVEVHAIELLSEPKYEPISLLHLRIACSRGTYIRSLARDLGVRLGCGGSLFRLIRTQSGDHQLKDAVPLSQIGSATVRPLRELLAHLPLLQVSADAVPRLQQGLMLHAIPKVTEPTLLVQEKELIALIDGDGLINQFKVLFKKEDSAC